MAENKSHPNVVVVPEQANKLVSNEALSKKIKAIFFDLDNTLIPTRTGDSKAIRKLAELLENQYSFSKEESTNATQSFLKAFRRAPDNPQTSLDSWRTHLWRDALSNRHKHLAEQIYPIWLQLRYRYLALTSDYVHMLKAFRERGILLALITNGPSNAQWEKIKKINVPQYFDCILVSSDLPWEKPNPNIFYAACNFLGVKPIECGMIGDKLETDIKGGRLANLGATFWLPLNPTDADDLTDVSHPPDYILKQLLDLYKYFPFHHHAHIDLNSSSNSRRNGACLGLGTSSSSSSSTSHMRRRGSQMTSIPTSSNNCDNDIVQSTRQQASVSTANPRNFFYFNNNHHNHQRSYLNTQPMLANSSSAASKYRRGNSLPAMDCMNSETENSLDSVCN